jgi:hypothetical protein
MACIYEEMYCMFQTNPTDHPPKHLYLFCMLGEQLKAEEDSLLSARQMEEEVCQTVHLLEIF